MVLVIDTGSARSALAVLDGDLRPAGEAVRESGPGFDVAAEVRSLVDARELSAIAVARGPGSFTGLRVGAAYAVGLALGLGLPLRPFGSLELQSARARGAATAAADAGRGRLYYLPRAGARGLGEPADLPAADPVAGWLRPATISALEAAGRRVLEDGELLDFAAAAGPLVRLSPEIPCDSLTIEYMQSLGVLK